MLQIFAVDLKTKERFEITDLYFFKEQDIHCFGGEAHYDKYSFEVFVDDVMVYPLMKFDKKHDYDNCPLCSTLSNPVCKICKKPATTTVYTYINDTKLPINIGEAKTEIEHFCDDHISKG